MKRNLNQKIKCLLCGVLLLVPLFPFSVSADTISSSNIVGVNRVLIDSEYIKTEIVNVQGIGSTEIVECQFNYEITVLLDDYYIGYINGSFQTSVRDLYWSDGSYYYRTQTKQNDSYYVNGDSFTTSFSIIAKYRNVQGSGIVDPCENYQTTFTLNTSNITKYSDIDNIDQIISLLDDINLNTQSIQWNIPFESYSTISYSLKNNFDIYQFRNLNNYQIPLFTSYKNDVIYKFVSCPTSVNARYDYYNVVIMMDRSPSESTMNNNLILNDGQWIYESRLYEFNDGTKNWNIAKWHITNFQNAGNNQITLNYSDLDYCILYFGPDESESLISTDFALQFGFRNELLNNLNIIAQGTQQSSSSSSDLEDSADDIVQNSSTMFTFENQQNQNMNNALQSINTNYDIGSFGSSFLSSANWVRTQFDNITSSTPFGSVLSFSLLLGLALLIIGKVYK